jgi:hypothetical protein
MFRSAISVLHGTDAQIAKPRWQEHNGVMLPTSSPAGLHPIATEVVSFKQNLKQNSARTRHAKTVGSAMA